MSTLADELLNDFEDSGSDAGGEEQQDSHDHGLFDYAAVSNGVHTDGDTAMDEVHDDDDEEDEDADMMDGLASGAAQTDDDPTEAKAKIEKMQLGAVRDVRAVAGLMKTLTPVLEP